MVAAGVADEMLVQVAYAIGVANPVGIYVNTFGTCNAKKASGNKYSDNELADIINNMFDLRPNAIIKRPGLKRPVFFRQHHTVTLEENHIVKISKFSQTVEKPRLKKLIFLPGRS
jgi:S-adenosylmethionine synthetase